MKILIADDNPTNRKLLRVVLEAEGAEVVEVTDGAEALAALQGALIDVVISDVLMPNKDGYELCFELRKADAFRHLPFIFYTNTYTSASSEKLAYEFGADGFIKKPASAELIVETLRKVMDTHTRKKRASAVISYPGVFEGSGIYNKTLIGKLEEQNLELEATKTRLLQINHQLLERTKALETAEDRLKEANLTLESRVRERTRELELTNEELEMFAYTVSHDLQAPLRAIDGFGGKLDAGHGGALDAEGRRILGIIRSSAGKMRAIIEALLEMSRVSHLHLRREAVDLTRMARSVIDDLSHAAPAREVEVVIGADLAARGDPVLLRIALTNLLGNAWKYTARQPQPRIEVGRTQLPGRTGPVLFVRDNGAGFDVANATKLFRPFERLHGESEFSGSGIGLATVHRIVRRHGGEIWAEGEVGRGAVFYFTLPETEPDA